MANNTPFCYRDSGQLHFFGHAGAYEWRPARMKLETYWLIGTEGFDEKCAVLIHIREAYADPEHALPCSFLGIDNLAPYVNSFSSVIRFDIERNYTRRPVF